MPAMTPATHSGVEAICSLTLPLSHFLEGMASTCLSPLAFRAAYPVRPRDADVYYTIYQHLTVYHHFQLRLVEVAALDCCVLVGAPSGADASHEPEIFIHTPPAALITPANLDLFFHHTSSLVPSSTDPGPAAAVPCRPSDAPPPAAASAPAAALASPAREHDTAASSPLPLLRSRSRSLVLVIADADGTMTMHRVFPRLHVGDKFVSSTGGHSTVMLKRNPANTTVGT